MSYQDDEELKIGEFAEEDEDLDVDAISDDALDDDLAVSDDPEEESAQAEGFAGLDGSIE